MEYAVFQVFLEGNSSKKICHCERSVAIAYYTELKCMSHTRSWPREGQSLCSHKVTKRLVSRNASLPHLAFALQIGQNHGLLNLTSTSFAQFPTLRQGLLMPLQPHYPASFCPLSPEAYLLTGEKKSIIH
jgi:hypothetical protein